MNAKQRRTRARAPYRRAWLSMRATWSVKPPAHKRELLAEFARIKTAIERRFELLAEFARIKTAIECELRRLFDAHGGKVPYTGEGVKHIEETIRQVLVADPLLGRFSIEGTVRV